MQLSGRRGVRIKQRAYLFTTQFVALAAKITADFNVALLVEHVQGFFFAQHFQHIGDFLR